MSIWPRTPTNRGRAKQRPSRRPPDHVLSEEDAAILGIARHLFDTFGRPGSQSWRHAIAASERLGGPPGLLTALVEAVEAMCLSRRSVFRFSNPNCPGCAAKLTPHERQFMACLRHVRRGEPDLAARHAFLLCEGNDTRQFLDSIGRIPARGA
ncbi:hypothetical protein [Mangrovicoccus ximenensis]|uniref:hypothetical protein n=1 Tax=Mangrovicoccus ximenensis TaxID=1911570 RepID=UPI000D387F62|nr:hypothetical protein [Mangrovicoccus ximenensis]